jgi:hypothetical protein
MIKTHKTKSSGVYSLPELPICKPTGNSFNPPRCTKCHTISYYDTDENICKECSDEYIKDSEIYYEIEQSADEHKENYESDHYDLEGIRSLILSHNGTKDKAKKSKLLAEILGYFK